MIRLTLTLLVSGLFTLFSLQPAFAAPPAAAKAAPTEKAAPTQVPMSTVLQNLHMNGYDIVTKIELDNGDFAIDAITPQGKKVEVLMKAQNGEITQPKKNPAPAITIEEAVKRVEAAGYHDISTVQYNGSKYVLKAINQKNKKEKLKVDGATGDISTSWF